MESGRGQLRDWINRRFPKSSRRQRDAAEYLLMDETFLTKLLTGVRQPGLTNAVKIERHTGIPIEAWMSSELDESEPAVAAKGRKRA
jgi:hypothetical protein